ncbi:hypothetical protein KR100_13795 [Synechococcus sp. KORDI-100]|nr:hypothetical protein KR100_13795 [Synechococcus sp. KORDI-100]
MHFSERKLDWLQPVETTAMRLSTSNRFIILATGPQRKASALLFLNRLA